MINNNDKRLQLRSAVNKEIAMKFRNEEKFVARWRKCIVKVSYVHLHCNEVFSRANECEDNLYEKENTKIKLFKKFNFISYLGNE